MQPAVLYKESILALLSRQSSSNSTDSFIQIAQISWTVSTWNCYSNILCSILLVPCGQNLSYFLARKFNDDKVVLFPAHIWQWHIIRCTCNYTLFNVLSTKVGIELLVYVPMPNWMVTIQQVIVFSLHRLISTVLVFILSALKFHISGG